MTDREQYKTEFAGSRLARKFVIPVLKSRLYDIGRSWYDLTISDRTRLELAVEKQAVLKIAGWLGIQSEVNPDAPQISEGHPSSASAENAGT